MTHWYDRKPGQTATQLDAHTLIVGDLVDWMHIPEDAPHPDAGKRLRVEERYLGRCPKCRLPCRHYTLRGSDLRVAECTHGCAFMVYTLDV